MARSSPISMAMVRSNITVRRNVTTSTDMSLLGALNMPTTVRQPLMLYDTTISTAARHDIGTRFIRGIRKRNMSSSTRVCTIPATGVRPPFVMLIIVRAIAPVTGIPPKNGTTILAMPCPISSVFEFVREPVTPSATVADSSDSIAHNMAIVKAEGRRRLMVFIERSKPSGVGMSVDRAPKRSPIVSTCMPGTALLRIYTTAVISTIAMSEPGSFRDILGVMMITAREASPTPNVTGSIFPRLARYTPHLDRNSEGTSVSPSPKKSLIWVENIVNAIPLVKPTTIG
ncbi:hypothetical protein IMSAG192_00207 [Muribaculaceae bacterium]|nr:hypothetical protein IMSAG192_00207 [Muribaculaceae bacterium]